MAQAASGYRRVARCAAARRALAAGTILLSLIAGRAAAGDDGLANRPIALPVSVSLPESAAAEADPQVAPAERGDAPAPASTPIASPIALPKESAAAPERTIAAPGGSFASDAVRTVVALALVLALALVVRHVAKRLVDPLAARRPSGVVQVLGRFPLAKGQSILLIAVGTRVICAHQAAGRVETLCEFSDPQEIALLRTRIEAGTPGREQFERELVRSLERDESVVAERPKTLAAARPAPIVTETVDLTKRRPAAMRLVGVRA